eukprot:COSAG05_NODE_436_length_9838_cov_49.389876_5_plen_210_part_00
MFADVTASPRAVYMAQQQQQQVRPLSLSLSLSLSLALSLFLLVHFVRCMPTQLTMTMLTVHLCVCVVRYQRVGVWNAQSAASSPTSQLVRASLQDSERQCFSPPRSPAVGADTTTTAATAGGVGILNLSPLLPNRTSSGGGSASRYGSSRRRAEGSSRRSSGRRLGNRPPPVQLPLDGQTRYGIVFSPHHHYPLLRLARAASLCLVCSS